MEYKNIKKQEDVESEVSSSSYIELISLLILYFMIEYLYGNIIALIIFPCLIILITVNTYLVIVKNERDKIIMNQFKTLELYLSNKNEIVLKEGFFIVDSSYIENLDKNRILEFIVSLESKYRLSLIFNKNKQQYELISLNINDTCILITT
jgi:hypothetical protein